MNIIRRFLACNEILSSKGEESFPYIYRSFLTEGSPFLRTQSRRSGVLIRILYFFKFIFSNVSWNTKLNLSGEEILAFATSKNQLRSISPIINELYALDRKVALLVDGKASASHALNSNMIQVKFHITDVIIAIWLFLFRSLSLSNRLGKLHRSAKELFFDAYCVPYIYLPYFIRLLSCNREIRCILLANDHVGPTVSLLYSASLLDVKTIYVQHASVNYAFPPLQFDLAFLDGVASAEIYSNISKNLSGLEAKHLGTGGCVIILSGQQKLVRKKKILRPTKSSCISCIGVGVNLDDNVYDVAQLAAVILENGLRCRIRFHPRQKVDFIDALKRSLSDLDGCEFSDGAVEEPDQYLSEIDALLAANTGLHLEAALKGIPTFYIGLSDLSEDNDKYGFVEAGISLRLKLEEISHSGTEIPTLLSRIAPERDEHIKKYSESYKTIFQNREGWCVATAINDILCEQDIGYPFEYVGSMFTFATVYRLRVSN